VAVSLYQTPEGASLRASLPTLRRAAGLCARCARPYKGIADACPACLTGAPTPTTDDDGEAEDLDPTDPGAIQ
jgi:predicted amidophosphoribosyltransferase